MLIALVFIASVLFCVSALAWLAQGWLAQAWQRYRTAFTREAQHSVGEFFLFINPAHLWAINLLVSALVAFLAFVFTGAIWLAAGMGVGALAAPQWCIRYLRLRRRALFDEQLPDLLLALAGTLRAGSGVQTALKHIIPSSPIPLSQEFGLMLREQRMGVDFEQALVNLHARMPSEGMALIVSSLCIAAQTGGNLAETLEGIAHTQRSRLHLLARVRALTSQGRMQAWVMACLPLFLALALEWLDPVSMALFWHTPVGWGVIAVIVLLELAGVLFIRRIVSIDV